MFWCWTQFSLMSLSISQNIVLITLVLQLVLMSCIAKSYNLLLFQNSVFIWLRRIFVLHVNSGCGSQAPEHRLSSCGIWTDLPQSIWDLSSLTRDRTCIPCIMRQILNHWMAREVPHICFLKDLNWQIWASQWTCLSLSFLASKTERCYQICSKSQGYCKE